MNVQHSGNPQLVQSIIERIQSSPRRAIPFKEYMELCLYHPLHGYYRTERPKIGKQGDFYTSSSVGSVMGEMLAVCFLQHAKTDSGEVWNLVEWGGGTGRLARQILDEIQRLSPEQYSRLQYVMIESSPYHRSVQAAELLRHIERVRFLSEMEWFEGSMTKAILFSNELLDAFPVERIVFSKKIWQEIYVAWDEARQSFFEAFFPVERDRLAMCELEGIKPREGQRFEVHTEGLEWLGRVLGSLKEGTVISIDYGDTAQELYAPHRMNGTLLCYRDHRASDNPYEFQGLQDMTSHVNFSSCIRVGEELRWHEAELLTQREFLVRQGILERLQAHDGRDPFSAQAKRNRSIRQLLLSDGMSELFKVLIQVKKTAP